MHHNYKNKKPFLRTELCQVMVFSTAQNMSLYMELVNIRRSKYFKNMLYPGTPILLILTIPTRIENFINSVITFSAMLLTGTHSYKIPPQPTKY